MNQTERFRRVVVELLIIVAGVLIALGAQSAAQEWSDRRHERAFLLDLLAEFRLNEEQLHKDIKKTGQAVSAADEWRSKGTDSVKPEGDSSAAFYAASLNPARFDPISGSLRSLIDGGDLRLIRNRQLRAALAGWGDRTQEQIMTSITVDMMRSTLTQFLVPEGLAAPAQALELDRVLLQVTYDQQRALLDPLREIISMLELETGT
jgi:hypothetical protein